VVLSTTQPASCVSTRRRRLIVVLSSADTTLSLLASVVPHLEADFPALRLANQAFLRQPASVDFYVDDVLKHARVIVIDHLGGEAYWPYGIESITTLARRNGQMLVMFSGDLQEDPNLVAKSTAEPALCDQLWRYLREGGAKNAEEFLRCIAFRALGYGREARAPSPLPAVAIYHPARQIAIVDDWKSRGFKVRPSSPCCSIEPICSPAIRTCSMR
jgi:cobaltochelatase CobN